jgi:hypothetical protein
VYVNRPEELGVDLAVGLYYSGRIPAEEAVERLREVRSRQAGSRPDRLAACYLGDIAAEREQPTEAEAMYRIALDPAHPEIAATAAASLGLMLCGQEGRHAEGEALLRQAASSGHDEAAARARQALSGLRSGPRSRRRSRSR